MPSSLFPIITTPNLDRVLGFYAGVLGAKETSRVPAEGPVFYLGLQVGDSELGLVADTGADTSAPQRMLISVQVDDVDELLLLVSEHGGRVLGLPNDMPWGQRVAHVQDPDGNAVNLTQEI